VTYRYDPSRAALLAPARGATFFPAGRPKSEAALCAELSRLSYAPFDSNAEARREVEGHLKRVGFSVCYFFSTGGTQAYLACDTAGALTVLVFRGTETKRVDWVTDLQAWPCAWPEGGRVHTGFAEALGLVWNDLKPYLTDLPGRRLYTGHSLGAALATLAASRRAPDALYTFGSPRVGDDAFIKTLGPVESHRYTNCCDVICRIPMELFGYRHFGSLLYIDRKGGVRSGCEYREGRLDRLRARLSYSVRWAWRTGTMWTRDLADHSPVNYFSALSGIP
jgi:triacylglycerol lipase